MANLTDDRRKKMPSSSYRLAISGATRSYNAGNIGKSTEEKLKSKARGKLYSK